MKQLFYIIALITLTTGLHSCERVKNKTAQVVENVKEKAKAKYYEYGSKVAKRIFPPFDHDTPDTDDNKKRFKDFIRVKITPDIKNIYCYDDAIGIDATYLFSFDCNPETSAKIIALHDLSIDSQDSSTGFASRYDFKWWDYNIIKDLKRYQWVDPNRFYKYYWYDSANNKAYYMDFDM